MGMLNIVKKIGRRFNLWFHQVNHLGNIYLFKTNNRNTRKRGEICSKLTIKTPDRRQRLFCDLLLTLNIFQTFSLSFHC